MQIYLFSSPSSSPHLNSQPPPHHLSKPAGGTKAPKKTKHYNSFMNNSNFKLKQEQGFRTKKDDDYNYYHLCMNICRRLDDVTQEVKVDSVKRLHDISLMLDLSLLSNKDTLPK